MDQVTTNPVRPVAREQRKLRNYLLDRHFQLKYANFAAGIALAISVLFGLLLWQASESTLAQSRAAVELGEEVLAESKKVSEVVAMNIAKDPVYSADPALRQAFEAGAAEQSARRSSQQQRLLSHAAALSQQRTQFALLLFGVLASLVVALWLAGIVITHRVAGPVYKMKRQIRAVRDGNLSVPSPLRKGDELKDFFDTFNEMVSALRGRRQEQIEILKQTISDLEGNVPEEKIAPLKRLLTEVSATLDAPPPQSFGPGRVR